MAISEGPAHVLVIPYPAQGHMQPLLDLARLLSLRGLGITVVVTPKNLPLLSSLLSSSLSIQPLILPFPSSHLTLFPGVENSKDLPPSITNYRLFIQAFSYLRSPILEWARTTPHPPHAVISDIFLGWTNDLALELCIPRLVFSPCSAIYLSVIHCLWLDIPSRPQDCSYDANYPISFPSVPNSPTFPWYQLSSLYRSYVKGEPVSELLREGFLANMTSWGLIINTFDDLEAIYLHHLSRESGHQRVWAVGPLNTAAVIGGGGCSGLATTSVNLMAWLDMCEVGSVVYVCFGTQVVLSAAQTASVAAALEQSGVRFVWCVREGGPALPEGYEERVAERGVVVRGWVLQVEVLGHRAVRSFLTHCGWNSLLEGIAAGVLLLLWPMQADHYMSARLMAEMGIGVRICEGADAVPDPNDLAPLLVSASLNTNSERSRAKDMKRTILDTTKKGGSSANNIDALAEMLSELKSEKELAESSEDLSEGRFAQG